MGKSFYHYVLTFRGGEWSDEKTRFSEGMFIEPGFPKYSESFEELSTYIELQSNEYLTISAFDELWDLYAQKYDV
ncbi:YozE family protein [Solibacillus sp. FSL K6-1523]|uniref:YozE family protein n=1 Tax=Solibacillus sp. FSL K6-1523 TaxID=2921471 RepID=UPI0030F5FB9A